MKTENSHAPAFPADSQTQTDGGLTKREYTAIEFAKSISTGAYFNGEEVLTKVQVAELAIEYTDELLKQLSK